MIHQEAAAMAKSTIAREGLLNKTWSYDYGVVWRGMQALYELTGEKGYFDYIKDGIDTFVDAEGEIRDYKPDAYNLDYICNGRQLLYLYKQTGEEKYRLAADRLRNQLSGQPRTSDGGFWHKQCYPCQMWLDGLHMAQPFYLEYALMTGDEQTIDDVQKQFILCYQHTLDKKTGLNRHAWDEKHAQPWANPATGLAAHCWARAVGWYMAGLVDVLELMGGRECGELKAIFERLCQKMLSMRQQGVWEQVVDAHGRNGNYLESSGSCLMVYAMLKGARLGFIPKSFGAEARESYQAILDQFVYQMKDGRMFLGMCCQCAGLGGDGARDGSYAYYISEPVISYDLKGTGAFLQAACERERCER